MKKLLLLVVTLITLTARSQTLQDIKGKVQWQIPLPQLQAGVYVHDTLFWTNQGGTGNCGQWAEYNICFDNGLIPLATGVNFELIITTLTQSSGSVYTDQLGTTHLYDSLIFTATNQCFSFHFNAPGTLEGAFVVAGMPTIPFENYPCMMQDTFYSQTISSCVLHFDLWSASQTNCSVGNFNAVSEQILESEIHIFPNPFFEKLSCVVNRKEHDEIILYDIASRKILQQKFINSVSLNTEQLAKGLYLYEVRDRNGLCKKGKVVKD